MNEQHPDWGLTLIEVLLVIVVLGLLGAVVTAAADGIAGRADRSACDADRSALEYATEAYFAEQQVDAIPAADVSPDGVERTLVEGLFLRSVSSLHDVSPTGAVTPAASGPCAG